MPNSLKKFKLSWFEQQYLKWKEPAGLNDQERTSWNLKEVILRLNENNIEVDRINIAQQYENMWPGYRVKIRNTKSIDDIKDEAEEAEPYFGGYYFVPCIPVMLGLVLNFILPVIYPPALAVSLLVCHTVLVASLAYSAYRQLPKPLRNPIHAATKLADSSTPFSILKWLLALAACVMVSIYVLPSSALLITAPHLLPIALGVLSAMALLTNVILPLLCNLCGVSNETKKKWFLGSDFDRFCNSTQDVLNETVVDRPDFVDLHGDGVGARSAAPGRPCSPLPTGMRDGVGSVCSDEEGSDEGGYVSDHRPDYSSGFDSNRHLRRAAAASVRK
jgi:hypothetical protein